MQKYAKLMRIHHYIKNFLIFAALICSGQLLNSNKIFACILGFISFCAISSAVYIINDIQDVEKDRMHPKKKYRPIAAGTISVKEATFICLVLTVLSCGLTVFKFGILPLGLILLYLVINIVYSMGLKNRPLVDVCILVSGFLLRIVYGALITNIQVSDWLYLTVIAISFYFALGKRRNELRQNKKGDTRKVLQYYTDSFLDKNMYMCLSLANIFYALWCMDTNTIQTYGNRHMIFTVPIVLIITMKYSLDVEGTMDGDPVEVLVHDKILMLLVLIYGAIMMTILYI